MPLLWRSTHCRGRRNVEEYSSLEVSDSDNNSIKESVEFSEPSFRTNFIESPLEVASDSHFSLEVALELYFPVQNADLLLLQNLDRKRERERERERESYLLLVCSYVFN